MEALLRKNGLKLGRGVKLDKAVKLTDGYSGAELELVLLQAANLSAERNHKGISQKDIDDAVVDVIPSRDTRMLEYMELLAVFEATARRMLPDRYAEMDTSSVQEQIDQLRMQLGRRAL